MVTAGPRCTGAHDVPHDPHPEFPGLGRLPHHLGQPLHASFRHRYAGADRPDLPWAVHHQRGKEGQFYDWLMG